MANRENIRRGEILVYQTDDGKVKFEVRLKNETLWLPQQMPADKVKLIS